MKSIQRFDETHLENVCGGATYIVVRYHGELLPHIIEYRKNLSDDQRKKEIADLSTHPQFKGTETHHESGTIDVVRLGAHFHTIIW